MLQITCTIANKTFNIKKICKVCDMPKSCRNYWTAFTPAGMYDIWITDNGVLYSKPLRQA